MSYEILYDNQPLRFLKRQSKSVAKRLLDKIETDLAENPVPHDAKRIVGERNSFRLRIGKFRVLYRISHEAKQIVIYKLDKRSRAFR